MTQAPWYSLQSPDDIDSPSLLVYKQRVEANIARVIEVAGAASRVRPHVKTHKLPQVVQMHAQHNIRKLKCATIAEAEMACAAGAEDVLVAHQLVGPKQKRLVALAEAYPKVQVGCVVDNPVTMQKLSAESQKSNVTLNVWIDIDPGMGRSGIAVGDSAETLAKLITDAPNLNFAGLHVYDGQFAALPIDERIAASNAVFEPVRTMVSNLAADGVEVPNIVAGGSPTFPVHALRTDVDVSPGTYVFWDAGYGSLCPEQPFEPAALVFSRVISKLSDTRLCLDLGSKSVSADNPIENRVRFLNAPDAVFIGQSEEHLVIELPDASGYQVGDVFYGVPWHICPTVALHQEALVIDESGALVDRWPVTARDRRITI